MEKYLIATWAKDHDEESESIDSVIIRNTEKEARKEFELQIEADDCDGLDYRVVMAKVIDCVDVEVVTTLKRVVVSKTELACSGSSDDVSEKDEVCSLRRGPDPGRA